MPPATAPTVAPTTAPPGPPTIAPPTAPVAAPVAGPLWANAGVAPARASSIVPRTTLFIIIFYMGYRPGQTGAQTNRSELSATPSEQANVDCLDCARKEKQ